MYNALIQFFKDYPYVVYSILGWGFILIFIRLKPIKRLWPIGIMGALILFVSTKWLVTAGVYKFNIDFLPIMGIPFFYLLWGASSGVVFGFFYRKKLYIKALLIFGFPLVVLGLEQLVENVGRVEHLGKFTIWHEYIFDVIILMTLAYVMENIFPNRLKDNQTSIVKIS